MTIDDEGPDWDCLEANEMMADELEDLREKLSACERERDAARARLEYHQGTQRTYYDAVAEHRATRELFRAADEDAARLAAALNGVLSAPGGLTLRDQERTERADNAARAALAAHEARAAPAAPPACTCWPDEVTRYGHRETCPARRGGEP